MNSTRRKTKSPNDYGNPAKCFVWYGSPSVSLEPLLDRNLSQNIFYSVNKKSRWNIEEELLSYTDPFQKWSHSFGAAVDSNPSAEDLDDPYNVARVAHKRHHNVIEVEKVDALCQADLDLELLTPQKPIPKKRRQHRNHHRPDLTTSPPEVVPNDAVVKDTAFVVFPRSDKTKTDAPGHRHKVTATNRASRGRKQGRRAKHAWHSAKLVNELRNETEELDPEVLTDDEYEQAFQTFVRKVHKEPEIDLNTKGDSWYDDELPWFADWPDMDDHTLDTEAFQSVSLDMIPTSSCTAVVPVHGTTTGPQEDILSQFERLLCQNKTTLEYLRSAVEHAQSVALWKYLEFIMAPFDNEIPRYPDDVANMSNYSVPGSATYTTTWCTQATTPWTMISDTVSTWTDWETDWSCPDRQSVVNQWQIKQRSNATTDGETKQFVWDLCQSRPDVRLDAVPVRNRLSKKPAIPKQLSYLRPRCEPIDHVGGNRKSRTAKPCHTVEQSTSEMDDNLTFIRPFFGLEDDETVFKPQKTRSLNPPDTDKCKQSSSELDENLEFIRSIFDLDADDGELVKKSPKKRAPTRPNTINFKPRHCEKQPTSESDENLEFIRSIFDLDADDGELMKKPLKKRAPTRPNIISHKRPHDEARTPEEPEVDDLAFIRLVFGLDADNQEVVKKPQTRPPTRRTPIQPKTWYGKEEEEAVLMDVRLLFTEELQDTRKPKRIRKISRSARRKHMKKKKAKREQDVALAYLTVLFAEDKSGGNPHKTRNPRKTAVLPLSTNETDQPISDVEQTDNDWFQDAEIVECSAEPNMELGSDRESTEPMIEQHDDELEEDEDHDDVEMADWIVIDMDEE